MFSVHDPSPEVEAGWVLVVPVKHSSVAKSRLQRLAGTERPALAVAMALDTVQASLATPSVRSAVVVTDDTAVAFAAESLGAVTIADEPEAGLNPALRHGVAHAVGALGAHQVACLSSDLPALRPRDLEAALTAAADARAATCLVADASGTGTTLLTYRVTDPGKLDGFVPRFGPDSRAAHRKAGAHELSLALPSLRRDVDTSIDLADAVRLGVGPRTEAMLQGRLAGAVVTRSAPSSPPRTAATVVGHSPGGVRLVLDDGRAATVEVWLWDRRIRRLREGQRVLVGLAAPNDTNAGTVPEITQLTMPAFDVD